MKRYPPGNGRRLYEGYGRLRGRETGITESSPGITPPP